jgi:hypothetical protein
MMQFAHIAVEHFANCGQLKGTIAVDDAPNGLVKMQGKSLEATIDAQGINFSV